MLELCTNLHKYIVSLEGSVESRFVEIEMLNLEHIKEEVYIL